jgi:hypothetical protein
MGTVMPSWYVDRMHTWKIDLMNERFDCLSFDIENREEDERGLAEAARFLNELIDIEVNEHGIPLERIIIGGLSQGGAVTCRTLTTTERKLGGAFILSSYVPLRRKVPEVCRACLCFCSDTSFNFESESLTYIIYLDEVSIVFLHADTMGTWKAGRASQIRVCSPVG